MYYVSCGKKKKVNKRKHIHYCGRVEGVEMKLKRNQVKKQTTIVTGQLAGINVTIELHVLATMFHNTNSLYQGWPSLLTVSNDNYSPKVLRVYLT